MRVALAGIGGFIGVIVGFVGWAPARIINERTYVSTGLGLLIGGGLGWLLANWLKSRSDRSGL